MAGRRSPDPLNGKFSVILENDRQVWISGSPVLLVYENEKIVIKLRGRLLTVSGSSLALESYGERELCVSGTIKSISLEEHR